MRILLAHRTPEDVGLAETVAGKVARDLLDLLLIGDDAISRPQDRLQLGMQVIGGLVAKLSCAIGRDVGHRARPVERHQDDQVFEAVRPHVDERPPHAGAFHLEHAHRLAVRQHLVSLGVVERQAGKIEIDAAPPHQLDGAIEYRERFQAEKIKLHQARRLDPFHVELGHRHQGFGIAVERHQLGQRPIADDDAGGVRGGVAVKPFEPLRDVEGAPGDRIAVALGLQPRLVLDRARERNRVGRILRHQLAQPVDLPIRHLQHAADVAQHAARLQGAERDDLGDAVVAVAILHIADDFVAPLLAEVDVEVRHRDALGIEEALEQKPEADRIEIGDGERIGDQRAGAGAAARPDRDALRLRPLDEIGDDQEVAGIFHAGDDAELEGEPLAVILGGVARRQRIAGEPALEAGESGAAKLFGFLGFVRLLGLFGLPRARRLALPRPGGEARQDRRQRARAEGAAFGDLDRRRQRLRQIGEQRRHFGAALEAVLGRELAALAVGQQPALGDAQKRVVRLVILAGGEERLVGGDQRNAARIGKLDQGRLGQPLGRHAVALQFDIEPIAEQALQRFAAR